MIEIAIFIAGVVVGILIDRSAARQDLDFIERGRRDDEGDY